MKLKMLKPVLTVKSNNYNNSFAASSRGTAEQRGYGSAWKRLRRHVLDRDCYLCVVCRRDGRSSAANAVDHIVPKSQGGSDNMSNLQSICNSCHAIKTQKESRYNI